MGKTALMAIAAFTVMSGYYGLNSQHSILGATGNVSAHQYEVIARNAAKAGFEHAKQQLAEDFANTATISGTYEEGHYSVMLSTDGELRTITSVGQSSGGTTEHTIYARFRQVSDTSSAPPDFMQHALFSHGDLGLSGQLSTDTVDVGGTESNLYNANIHTNGSLTIEGDNVRIRGFATYGGTADVQHVDVVLQPYTNPTDEPVLQKIQPYALAEMQFHPDSMEARAAAAGIGVDEVIYGNYMLDSDKDYSAVSSRKDPYIIRVLGDFDTGGAPTVKGYVEYIVDGFTTFGGDLATADMEGPHESRLAIYSNRDITIQGSADLLSGIILSNANIDISGEAEIQGSLIALGAFTGSGRPEVRYLPPSPALTTYWKSKDQGLQLLAYGER